MGIEMLSMLTFLSQHIAPAYRNGWIGPALLMYFTKQNDLLFKGRISGEQLKYHALRCTHEVFSLPLYEVWALKKS